MKHPPRRKMKMKINVKVKMQGIIERIARKMQ